MTVYRHLDSIPLVSSPIRRGLMKVEVAVEVAINEVGTGLARLFIVDQNGDPAQFQNTPRMLVVEPAGAVGDYVATYHFTETDGVVRYYFGVSVTDAAVFAGTNAACILVAYERP